MTQETLKKIYQLLLTEPHAPTVCAQLERIAREALAEHAMREAQRLGQEIEQEPVAWRNAAIRVGEDLCSVGPFGYYDMTAQQWLDWALSVVTVHAPPPQRKPLTNGEIYTAYITATNQTLRATDERLAFAFARAIEAAHGIKENT